MTIPKVSKWSKSKDDKTAFPVEHYSSSGMIQFTSNPILFKINQINKDYLETTNSASSVLGKVVHKALQAYCGGDPDVSTPADEGEAIKHGYDQGLKYLAGYSDGFIEYGATFKSRADIQEKFSYVYFGYIKEWNFKNNVKQLIHSEKKLIHHIEVDDKRLPVPLKGYIDILYTDKKGRLCIRDHKIVKSFSDENAIDGTKLLAAAIYYFLAYAEEGIAPHEITFAEFKYTENRDKSSQMREYKIVYGETPIIFDLFFRLYEDITNSLMGKQAFMPNLTALYDREISLLAYIYRLDIEEERAELMKKEQVDNITDLLKKKITNTKMLKRFESTITSQFISAKTLNYKDMTTEEKIRMKMATHGIALEFDSKIKGGSVELYRYEPSIGVKMSKIEQYVKDIEQVVEVEGVRILAPIPNTNLIGFEIPNKVRVFPSKKIKTKDFNLAIGEDVMGNTIKMDIREAPHMIVAGSTGSGKSVFLNTLIEQILTIKNTEMYLFDPKMVELSGYTGNKKVIKYADDTESIALNLMILCNIMDERYKVIKEAGVKNISGIPDMKYIFVVIDEYADLITASKVSDTAEIKKSIMRLAQKARACGIHLILTTQRPSVKVIDGDIKMNFPTRVAFRTATATDSKVIIDQGGAEKLLGKGDMLLMNNDGVQRLQGFSEINF